MDIIFRLLRVNIEHGDDDQTRCVNIEGYLGFGWIMSSDYYAPFVILVRSVHISSGGGGRRQSTASRPSLKAGNCSFHHVSYQFFRHQPSGATDSSAPHPLPHSPPPQASQNVLHDRLLCVACAALSCAGVSASSTRPPAGKTP